MFIVTRDSKNQLRRSDMFQARFNWRGAINIALLKELTQFCRYSVAINIASLRDSSFRFVCCWLKY